MITARAIIDNYGMQENPVEGGYFAPVYTSPLLLPANYATRQANRQLPICSAIYYMITRDNFSALHRVSSDMLYHFYAGDPVDVLLLDPNGDKQAHWHVVLGNDLSKKQHPALVIPAGTWMGSRVTGKAKGSFAFMGVSMAPGFDPQNYEIGRREALSIQFPTLANTIARYTRA